MTVYSSRLAPYIDGMIAQKRAMGYTYEAQEISLEKFRAVRGGERVA